MSAEWSPAPGGSNEQAQLLWEIAATMGSGATGSTLAPEHISSFDDAKAFEPFRAEVDGIEQLLYIGWRAEHIPGYIDQGSMVSVFAIGDRHVVKIPHREDGDAEEVMEAMAHAFKAGVGVPGLAQGVACSRGNPAALIVERVPGCTLADIGTRYQIRGAAFDRLFDTYREMQRRGLATDNHTSNNTIVTPEGSLVIVDYEYDPTQTLEEKVLTFGSDVSLLQDEDPGPLPDYAWWYRQACQENFGEELVEKLDQYWRAAGFIF